MKAADKLFDGSNAHLLEVDPLVIPLPCPFCGVKPVVLPENPSEEGNAWGRVNCQNNDCPARPAVADGDNLSDNRGSDEYKKLAILRWNIRKG